MARIVIAVAILCTLAFANAQTADLSLQDLTSVPKASIPNDTSLVLLSYNDINLVQAYDFANLPQLVKVKIDHNNVSFVSNLAFINSTALTILDFAYNQISCVCQLAVPNLQLIEVVLSHNPLSEMDPDDFKGFPALKYLKLQNTELSTYPNLTYIGQTLLSIYLSNNNLGTVDADLLALTPNIKFVVLSSCQLTKIPDFTKLPSNNIVRELSLNNPGLATTILSSDFDNLPMLFKVVIEYSNLVAFPDFGTAKDTVEVIYLSHNNIPTVDASLLGQMPKLRQLHLGFNLLTMVPDVRSLSIPITWLNLEENSLICESSMVWIGEALSNGDIADFMVEDPCEGQTVGPFMQPNGTSLGRNLFTRLTFGSTIDENELHACICQCALDSLCIAVSIQAGRGCVLDQEMPTDPPADQQWWARPGNAN